MKIFFNDLSCLIRLKKDEYKFKRVFFFENKFIKSISHTKEKLVKFDNLLIEKNVNIDFIKNNINNEQEIIVKLLLLEVEKDINKFEETIQQLYLILQNFDINNI